MPLRSAARLARQSTGVSNRVFGQLGRRIGILVTMMMRLFHSGRACAEDQADYKYEDYSEENGRMHIRTHSAFVEKELAPWLDLKGQFVYDGISGASPTGAPPPVGSSQVPTVYLEDIRRAGYIEPSFRWGRQTISPQAAYSLERDYESVGLSINDAIDFNQKNTTVNLGYAHNFDTVMPKYWNGNDQHKDTDAWLMGVTQILGPKTLLSANVTIGTARGYLSDPYKRVRFDGYPDPNGVFPEKRPGHRTDQILFLSLTQFIEKLEASVEVTYRFYHDSFGILGHTASVSWYQNLGKYVLLSPMFRFYEQNAADFYGVRFPGDPSDPDSTVPIPQSYSADYRLSALRSFTYGLGLTIKVRTWLWLDAAYKRYEMFGTDHVTSPSAYPKANVLTGGLRLWF